MKKRNVLIRLTGILFILLLVALYMLLYFFPTVTGINRLKREVKDTRSKIEEFVETEKHFSYPDKKERDYFAKAEREFKRKIPKIKGKRDLSHFIQRISGYFSDLAEKEGVVNLTLKPEIDKPAINIRDNLKYRRMVMRFSGELKNALNFINHIPRCKSYLTPEAVTLSVSENSLLFSTVVKIFYFSGKAAGCKQVVEDEVGLEIDFDSEVLLERVYHNIPERIHKAELPFGFGTFLKRSVQ